jgi:beta-galactosidase/beta-glucuronidase
VTVLRGGIGLTKPLPKKAKVLAADASWSQVAWIRPARIAAGRQLIAGFGDPRGPARYFFSDHGRLGFWWGDGHATVSNTVLRADHWQWIGAVVRDHELSLYVNGRRVAHAPARRSRVAASMVMGPDTQPWPDAGHFGGKIAGYRVTDEALDAHGLAKLAGAKPGTLTRFQLASPHWPVQTKQMAGQVTPQPPSTLPRSRAPFSEPVKHPVGAHPPLKALGDAEWTLGDWRLASADKLVHASGATLSKASYDGGKAWYQATVPGTVLTTLVQRGVYPDPDYGLNNMAIPESLHTHDWWYRTEFKVPPKLAGKRLRLTFNGINYASRVWINGKHVGGTKGAFARGTFDVTTVLKPGRVNAIAVRVSPPPHPGVPNEESLIGGPGMNGGMMELDGPTFLPTEGWDWMPSARDRDTGLWQDVTLRATGTVRIGAMHVVSDLPTADHERADLRVDVPLHNASSSPVHGTLRVSFGDIQVSRPVTAAPGRSVVHLDPQNTPKLVVHHPHLWWPNGYGKPYLYRMHVGFASHGVVSDQTRFRFGIRQISYELSLFDSRGRLRRVLVNFGKNGKRHTRVMDVRHKAILKTPRGWAYSLRPGAEHSPVIKDLKDTRLTPYLAIRVNGVRIAVKGGNWGMDDWRKRVSRKSLEPYFKLQKKAHFNVIRNWLGQNSEPAFYDLADQYGMLVFNDFWQSTQNDNIEPQNDTLFMKNARDVIKRYRNHPSIALWFGRNEGVPQPRLNLLLDKATARLDGTRLYMPSSNNINLWTSGPYSYHPPKDYFTKLARGFSVEVGTPSFPTLEAFKAMMPEADRWPISDDWAYHDWHQGGNGDVHSFMQAMATKYGKPTSLADFARKAQMMNYVTYRAIFEGFNAHLWTKNSGRLLWMSHPAWPSTMWQLYSHDYDSNGSYFGAMKGAEPLHVQMNLPDRRIVVINNERRAHQHLRLRETVYGLGGKQLAHDERRVDAAAGSVTAVKTSPDLNAMVEKRKLVFVELRLRASNGDLLSRNVYWTARKPADLRALNRLPTVALKVRAAEVDGHAIKLRLHNPSSSMALQTKLTLVDKAGKRILPVYYSDNYINLVPGETRTIKISAGAQARLDRAQVKVRGWNVHRGEVSVAAKAPAAVK